MNDLSVADITFQKITAPVKFRGRLRLKMVRSVGFEPTTPGSASQYSIR